MYFHSTFLKKNHRSASIIRNHNLICLYLLWKDKHVLKKSKNQLISVITIMAVRFYIKTRKYVTVNIYVENQFRYLITFRERVNITSVYPPMAYPL